MCTFKVPEDTTKRHANMDIHNGQQLSKLNVSHKTASVFQYFKINQYNLLQ